MNVLVRSLVGLASSILAACSNATTPDDASVGRDAADADIVTVSMDVARVDATLADGRVDARADSTRADSARDVVADSGSPFTTPIRHALVLVKRITRSTRCSWGFRTRRPRAPPGSRTERRTHDNAPRAEIFLQTFRTTTRRRRSRTTEARSIASTKTRPRRRQPTDCCRLCTSLKRRSRLRQLARNYVLADHFFSQMSGLSFPGHFALWTAQTLPVDNSDCDDVIVTRDAGADADAAAPTVCEEGAVLRALGARAPRSTISTFERGTCAIQADQRPCFDVPSVIDELPQGSPGTRTRRTPAARTCLRPSRSSARRRATQSSTTDTCRGKISS